jgi:hypothetical protein
MGLWREHTIPFLGRMTQAAQVDAMNGIRTPPQRSLRSLENLDESPHALRKTESQAGAKKDYDIFLAGRINCHVEQIM